MKYGSRPISVRMRKSVRDEVKGEAR